MYETKGIGNYPTITGPDKAAVGSAPPSLNQRADYVLEEAAKLRAFAETLRDDLHQALTAQGQIQPCRPGIDGKLIDASDHHEAIYSALNQIRIYLLG